MQTKLWNNKNVKKIFSQIVWCKVVFNDKLYLLKQENVGQSNNILSSEINTLLEISDRPRNECLICQNHYFLRSYLGRNSHFDNMHYRESSLPFYDLLKPQIISINYILENKSTKRCYLIHMNTVSHLFLAHPYPRCTCTR